MKLDQLENLKEEIARLQRRIADYENARDEEKERVTALNKTSSYRVWSNDFPVLTGALRRASLDLTRALAEFRK